MPSPLPPLFFPLLLNYVIISILRSQCWGQVNLYRLLSQQKGGY